MSIFVNLSNHPSKDWPKRQFEEAESVGQIVDIPFPHIDSHTTEQEIDEKSAEYLDRIVKLCPSKVMVQGEFTFTYAIVSKLLSVGIECVASCSNRVAKETKREDGSILRESVYEFEKFRSYGSCTK